MKEVVVVGGSIAAVTAAGTLRTQGWDGQISLVTEEQVPPYSRVPLSKGVLAGTQSWESAALPALPADVEVLLGRRAVALHTDRRRVELDDGTDLAYDGLVVATGARARRLAAPGQRGEHVVRTMADARGIAACVPAARTAVVVGAGFLGMEVASTLCKQGLDVTVIDRDPPLRRLLGAWLADLVVDAAVDAGVRFILAPDGVELVGDPVGAVTWGQEQDKQLAADLVVSAVGDLPNTEWLEASGLPLAGGLVVDDRCVVASRIVAAGDVAAREIEPGAYRRTPHWTNAVVQGQAAARSLLDPECAPYALDHYFWTEQFDLDIKMAGELPFAGEPCVLEGEPKTRSALVQWQRAGEPVAAATINHRMPVVRLKRLGRAV